MITEALAAQARANLQRRHTHLDFNKPLGPQMSRPRTCQACLARMTLQQYEREQASK